MATQASVTFVTNGWGNGTTAGIGQWATLFQAGSSSTSTTAPASSLFCIYSLPAPDHLQLQQLSLAQATVGVQLVPDAAANWQVPAIGGGSPVFPSSNTGAASAPVEESILVAWQGQGLDNSLWYALYDTSTSIWSPQNQILANQAIVGATFNEPGLATAQVTQGGTSTSGFITLLVWPGAALNGYYYSLNDDPAGTTPWTAAVQLSAAGDQGLVPQMAVRTLLDGRTVQDSRILVFAGDRSNYWEFDTAASAFVQTSNPLPIPAGLGFAATSVTGPSGNVYPLVVFANGEIAVINANSVEFAVPQDQLPPGTAVLSAMVVPFRGGNYLLLATTGFYYVTQITLTES